MRIRRGASVRRSSLSLMNAVHRSKQYSSITSSGDEVRRVAVWYRPLSLHPV
jgi:hypothetical protein